MSGLLSPPPMTRRRWLAGMATMPLLIPGCQRDASVLRIVVIPKGMTHEFWQSIKRGADRAADDFAKEGTTVQIIWDGPLRERDIWNKSRLSIDESRPGSMASCSLRSTVAFCRRRSSGLRKRTSPWS